MCCARFLGVNFSVRPVDPYETMIFDGCYLLWQFVSDMSSRLKTASPIIEFLSMFVSVLLFDRLTITLRCPIMCSGDHC